jgi:hypothetical protein
MRFLVLLALPILTACSSTPLYRTLPTIEHGEHKLTRPFVEGVQPPGLTYLSCTDKRTDGSSRYLHYDRAPTSKQPSHAELARRHFLHAAMASNVYREPNDGAMFVLPSWTLKERREGTSGLSLDVYTSTESKNSRQRLVVAYRGTDYHSILDWGANFSLWFHEPQQYRQAAEHLSGLLRDHPGAEVTVTGHSLGGAIALNLGQRFPGVSAVAFNSSPRAFFSLPDSPVDNQLVHIYESGEILNVTHFWLEALLPANTQVAKYNFLDFTSPSQSIAEHGIYRLARGLLLLALARGEESARQVFVASIPEAQAMKTDPENCEPLYKPSARS